MRDYYENGTNESNIFEMEGIHKSGHSVHFEISSKFVIDDNGKIIGIQGISRDISERKLAEKSKNFILDLYKKSENYDNDKIINLSLECAIELTQSEIGFLHFINPDQESISLQAWSEKTMKICEITTKETHYPVSKAGIWVDCLKQRKPVIHANYSSISNKKGLPEGHTPIIREATIPIFEGDRIVAILGVGNKKNDYTDTDIDLLTSLSANIWNIVRRKTAENTNRKLQKAVESSKVCIVITDYDGNIEFANPYFTESTGYTPQEYYGKNPRILKTELYNKTYYQHLWKTIKSGQTWEGEFQNRKKNGELYWEKVIISPIKGSNNDITHFVAIKTDITENIKITEDLIKAKEEAQDSKLKYKQIFENTLDQIFILEVTAEQRFKILTFNPSLEKLLGKLDLFQNKDIGDCFSPEIYNHINLNYERCIQEQKLITYEETLFIQGKTYTFFTQLIPLKNSIGRIYRIIGIAQNITENKSLTNQLINQNEQLKQLNLELTTAKEKAEESDRLKTAFLNNISHEIRTPLNAITGFAQLITLENQSSERLNKFSKIITSSSSKLIEIVSDVMEVSQLHSKLMLIKNSDFNFKQLVEEIIYEYKPQIINKKLDLMVNINPSFDTFNTISDRSKLCKILKHLIDNAVKFTHLGSIKIDFDFSHSDNKIEFSVADTGIGISQEMQEIIFEPFRQLEVGINRKYGGNGVGLALVKGYVQLLNGSLTMKTAPNAGTSFHISIPVEIVSKVKDILKVTQSTRNKIETILIVEDDQSNYEYLSELLHDNCSNILHALNGQQAIDICRNQKEINIVLMDIEMPVMDGYTATKLIKAFRPALPIIVQTAYALESDQEKFMETGFDGYIVKPIESEILINTIFKFINR
jgi:PAS domain S-box-containing protein